jgi:hypothetical protein
MKTNTPRTDAITQPGDWTHAELPRQMECDLYEAAKIIRRLLSYADRTVENHPRAVTSAGQNARVRAGIWLAGYERKNATNPRVKAQINES